MARSKNRARRGRGEGSVYQRKSDGRWVASVSKGVAGGKRNRLVAYGDTKQEAIEALRDLENKTVDPEKITVAHLGARWLSIVGPSLQPKTRQRYKLSIDKQITPLLGEHRVSALKPVHIEAWYTDMAKAGHSADAARKAGVLLLKMLSYAVSPLHLLEHNPARDVPLPRVDRKGFEVWTPEECQAFLEKSDVHRLGALYRTALASGMRIGELLGLHWDCVDFAGNAIVVKQSLEELNGHVRLKSPKTKAGVRRIDMDAGAMAVLHEHRKLMLVEGNGAASVFCTPKGTYPRLTNIRKTFRSLMTKAGVKQIRIHDLRHTSATLMLAAGVHPKIVSERLGHTSIQITLDLYSHVLPGMGKDAAEKLWRLLA